MFVSFLAAKYGHSKVRHYGGKCGHVDTVSIVPKITRNVNKREPLQNKFSQSCEIFLPNHASGKLLCVWGEKY